MNSRSASALEKICFGARLALGAAAFFAGCAGVAVFGAAAVILARPLLPYALGFAAGAMIFVVVEEVIPESQRNGHTDLATAGTILGFLVMMILDVAFG